MTLAQAHVGDTLLVTEIADPQAATMAMRLGISVGEVLTLAAKIPGGPLVVSHGSMELALGREVCEGILVQKQ